MTGVRARLVLVGVSVLVALLVGEVVVRLGRDALLPDEIRRSLDMSLTDIAYRPHPYVNWELIPGADMKSGETANEQGFRGPLRAIAKPDGVVRVACIGGSTTFTSKVRDRFAYPAQLEIALAALEPDKRIEVLNAGVPGYTTAESLMNLVFKVLDHEPDVVVVYHAYNDYKARTHPGYRRDYRHYRRVWVEEDCVVHPLVRLVEPSALFRFMRLRLTDHRRHGSLYYWVSTIDEAPGGPPPEIEPEANLDGFRDNLRAIHDVCRGRGIHLVLATQALHDTVVGAKAGVPLRKLNEVTRALAGELGAPLCDAARDFPQRFNFRPLDPVHMTGSGARLLAAKVAETIHRERLLRRRAPRPRLRFEPADDDGSPVVTSPPEPVVAPVDEPLAARLARGAMQEPSPYIAFAMSDGDEPTETQDGELRVLCLGGASTSGLGVADSESFPRRLEAKLREALDRPVTVINGAAPGYTTAESIGAFHFRHRPANPDVVVISHDVEDALPLLAPGYRTDYAHWRRTFRAPDDGPRAGCIGQPDHDPGVEPFWCGNPLQSIRAGAGFASGARAARPTSYAVHRNLRTLTDLALGAGARVVIAGASVAAKGDDPVATAVRPWTHAAQLVSGETAAQYVPLDDLLGGDRFLSGSHFLHNAAGHDLRAQRIAIRIVASLGEEDP